MATLASLSSLVGQDLIVGWATYIIVGADKGLAIRALNPAAIQHLRGWGDAVMNQLTPTEYKCTGYCAGYELLGLWPSELPDRNAGDTAAILSVDIVKPNKSYNTKDWRPTS